MATSSSSKAIPIWTNSASGGKNGDGNLAKRRSLLNRGELRNCGSVGSLNVFGRSNSGTIKVRFFQCFSIIAFNIILQYSIRTEKVSIILNYGYYLVANFLVECVFGNYRLKMRWILLVF